MNLEVVAAAEEEMLERAPDETNLVHSATEFDTGARAKMCFWDFCCEGRTIEQKHEPCWSRSDQSTAEDLDVPEVDKTSKICKFETKD